MKEIITIDNYVSLFPLFDTNQLNKERYYDITNLYQYILTNINYELINKRIDEVLDYLNNIDNLIMTTQVGRLDMDIDNPKVFALTVKKGSELINGDIIPTYRTCKSGLPCYITIDNIEIINDKKAFINGKVIGFIEYKPDKLYCVGTIIN